jgi:hypothetical protein
VYEAESSFIVPMNQAQYKLIKAMFEKRSQFKDSLFYDISSWTLPLAFGLEYEELKTVPQLGQKVEEAAFPAGKRIGGKSGYAYVFETYGYYAPRAMYRLLEKGIRIKVSTDPFTHTSGKRFERGSILVPVSGQEKSIDQIEYLLGEITQKDGIDVYAFHSGLDYSGSSLGSNSFLTVKKPVVAMLIGDGFTATDVGEMWHLFDTRFQIPITLLPVDVFNRVAISKYNTLIFPPTSGTPNISDAAKEKLKTWVQNGGVIIGLENAVTWFNTTGLSKFDIRKDDDKKDIPARAYADIEEFTGAQETSGAIFEARVDLTHPLLYGYYSARMPVFKSNNVFMEKNKNPYGNPLTVTANPLLSGYISKQNYEKLKNTSGIGVNAVGQGRVIAFTENLCFRAFWFGTNKMLTNAVFYGSLINSAAAR